MNGLVLPLYALAVRPLRPIPADDEAQLIDSAKQGNGRAFDALYRRHVQRVYARLTRLLGPTSDREDLVQQVFLQLHRALPSYRNEAPFGAFLHGIAARVGYDYLRQRGRQRCAQLGEDAMQSLVSPGSSPEAAARERQELRRAFVRLDALSAKKRVAFVLHVIEGVPLADMVRMLDVDARTLGQRVAYARRELLTMVEREQRAERSGGR
jgi:RNA polymerase sigma-70 factor (ECF subfamily)